MALSNALKDLVLGLMGGDPILQQEMLNGLSGGGGSGTVTSVGLSAPSSILNVSSSPVTTSGTLTLSLAPQTQNSIWSGPVSGTGSPTFRALVTADIPSGLPYASQTLSNLGTTAVNASIIPNTTNSISLGSGSKLWITGFFTTLQSNTLNTLTVSGNGSDLLVKASQPASPAVGHTLNLQSGSNNGAANDTGPISITTPNNTGSAKSGPITIQTGDTTSGDAGDINIVNGFAGSGNPTQVNLVSSALQLNTAHLRSIPNAGPSIAAQAGAGSGASAALLTASDVAGHASVTLGSSNSTGAQVVVTFEVPYITSPIVTLEPTDAVSGANLVKRFVTSTTNDFTISFGTAGVPSSSYGYNYHVIETQ